MDDTKIPDGKERIELVGGCADGLTAVVNRTTPAYEKVYRYGSKLWVRYVRTDRRTPAGDVIFEYDGFFDREC